MFIFSTKDIKGLWIIIQSQSWKQFKADKFLSYGWIRRGKRSFSTMSSLICLTCKEPVTDMRSAISVNEFKNLAAMHLVHKSCYFCSKCSTPLKPENAFVSDESKLRKVVLFRNKKYGMPEAVIQILPNRKNSINFGHLNFWTRGSKHIQAFLCIYRPRICFMGLHFTGLVNTGYRSVFTEKSVL